MEVITVIREDIEWSQAVLLKRCLKI